MQLPGVISGFTGGLFCGSAFMVGLVLLGIVPRIAHILALPRIRKKAGTALFLGAEAACIFTFMRPSLSLPSPVTAIISLLLGFFIGIMLASLAELIDVFPIMPGGIRFSRILIISLAAGKLVGSLLFFLTPHWS